MTAPAKAYDDVADVLPRVSTGEGYWSRVQDYAAALPPGTPVEVCSDCVEQDGLCGKDRCRRGILPQLARPALVRLIGDVLVEQKKRQKVAVDREKTARERVQIERIGRRNARKAARGGRRGYFGLAMAIIGKKPS